MNEIVAQSTGRAEFNMVVVTIFGSVALLLAAIGIYGLMTHSVQQRTHEMGIPRTRATPAALLRRIVWQGTRLALLGGGIGLLVSIPCWPCARNKPVRDASLHGSTHTKYIDLPMRGRGGVAQTDWPA